MTLAQAQKITGLEISEISRKPCVYAAFDNGVEVCRVPVLTPSGSLTTLVNILYRRMSQRVMREQGYRCFVTGAIAPLQIDHITRRSKGRRDTRENLRAVSAVPHELITNGRTFTPHPIVAEKMREWGLEWGLESDKVGWVRISQ